MTRFKYFLLLPLAVMLSGCNLVVLRPSGDVASQQANLIVISTVLMLIIIVPVMFLTVFFAWRYRAGNKEAKYEPDWDHSTHLELVIWAAPLLIIICLGALTWMWTHLLDPYRPLSRIAEGQPIEDAGDPLEVQVTALDWKWLFIYPEYGIASVNELAAPVNRPVRFRITSSSVMNSFYIPALAGQIYAMPGMETTLHGVINKPGEYTGFSANYSGDGFSGMHFAFHGLETAAFDTWVADTRAETGALDRTSYQELAKPSENVPVQKFGTVENNLFRFIRDRCVEPGKMCMDEMMAIDRNGGLGLAGVNLLQQPMVGDTAVRTALFGLKSNIVTGICTIEEQEAVADVGIAIGKPVNPDPLVGAGLARRSFLPFRAPMLDAQLQFSRPSGS
ncbi:ubiquinol oxidase subunit II [Oryzicola mucosus]|uniref:Ubiquinol oxidase polypeptide II n=1 Tax=Oryzicola mucosus TaxID=2767425 RepID=A0A8J6PID6_9HYPH|nr:ubiquinol oxidase subunit II [Oryzicola mucosus]MBD0415459.1 ubiquinol oxidase subunit II [Oryzicola mucosus]